MAGDKRHEGNPLQPIEDNPLQPIMSQRKSIGDAVESGVAGGTKASGTPRHPNHALEPTPTASARASLRLLARLTASVRRHRHTGTAKAKGMPRRKAFKT